MKNLISLVFLFIIVLTHAQIPSYVPSNGLVGWWPFNGNANDESGNGNNGTVNGATLTTDRFGVGNKAFSFNGSSKIQTINAGPTGTGITLSFWYKSNQTILMQTISYGSTNWGSYFGTYLNHASAQTPGPCYGPSLTTAGTLINKNSDQLQDTTIWHHAIIIIPTSINDLNSAIFYLDGVQLTNTCSFANYGAPSPNIDNGNPIIFGGGWYSGVPYNDYTGQLDDIGFWNRALTEAEILALYESCQLAITTQPQDQSVATSIGTASFSAASSGTNATYQWQTNLGLGYQNISNAGQYSGATSTTLTVSNLNMANDNQVFRCVVNEGTCADTTTEATLTIIDDVGIQNHTLTSLKLYPNPVQDVLHIDGLAGKEFEFEVLSIDGKLLQKGKSQGEISVKELHKGDYVLRVGQQQVSFVKQ